MSWVAIGGSVAGAVAGPMIGKMLGDDDKTTTTKVEMPAWQQQAMQNAINGMENAPLYFQNPDQLTANLNPMLMNSLLGAGSWAQGQGADQIGMMNLMGMNQAGVGDMLTQLANLQGSMGAGFAGGAGSYLLEQLANGGKGGGGGMPRMYGGGGNLKFEYDQGTYDTIMENLLGVTQNAFDSYAGKTKTDNLFSQGAGLQIGQQLLGGANTKAGQQSALLDAMTNQQIIDFGAQQSQWAAGQANQGAMNAGTANLQSATSMANARTAANASMANARAAANASMYNARLSAAGSLFGQGAGMMNQAGGSLANANNAYGAAGNTFGDANTQGINNLNTSLGAGNYLQQYDQAALDRYNKALMYNGNTEFDRYNTMLATLNGAPTGQSTTSPMNMQQWMSTGMMMGNQIGNILSNPTATGGWNGSQAGHSNPMDGWWM